ncbi:hypothetical protein [Xanthomonas bundabergensis]|uniref:hypothetical protein n=1 Tax=Xanthomonas bundabergensis TaxID=3160842 RepID=UPI00351302A0
MNTIAPALHSPGAARSCFLPFAQPITTLLPERDPSRLVRRGPCRCSRHPRYLSLALSYASLCVQIGWQWALPLLPLSALQRVAIPYEEARLRARRQRLRPLLHAGEALAAGGAARNGKHRDGSVLHPHFAESSSLTRRACGNDFRHDWLRRRRPSRLTSLPH